VGIVGRTRTFFGRHGAKMALGALFGLLFIAALGSVVFIGPLGEGRRLFFSKRAGGRVGAQRRSPLPPALALATRAVGIILVAVVVSGAAAALSGV
jgi:hypothetical protein